MFQISKYLRDNSYNFNYTIILNVKDMYKLCKEKSTEFVK